MQALYKQNQRRTDYKSAAKLRRALDDGEGATLRSPAELWQANLWTRGTRRLCDIFDAQPVCGDAEIVPIMVRSGLRYYLRFRSLAVPTWGSRCADFL